MSSINDVVAALKAKVDELGAFISGMHEQLDAAHAAHAAALADLDAARAENHDLRNQLQALTLAPAPVEYDPAADLQSVIEHLDALMGRVAVAPVEPAVEPVAEHVEEVAPLDSALATPSTVVGSTASLVETPVEPTLTLVTADPVVEPVVPAEAPVAHEEH